MKKFNINNSIIFEDEDYLVMNKPEKISSLNDRNSKINILNEVRQQLAGIKICHRLDKETSGVLLLAKHDEAYRLASSQFESREVKKVYHALVAGHTDFSDTLVDLPILVSSNPKVRIDVRKGKESQTIFSTIRNYRHHSFIECRPVTGRKHQIRIHLNQLGYPITGDVLYGGLPIFLSSFKRAYHNKEAERPLIDRMALHAFSLEFKNMSGENIYVEAPYPADFRVLLKQLDKFAS